MREVESVVGRRRATNRLGCAVEDFESGLYGSHLAMDYGDDRRDCLVERSCRHLQDVEVGSDRDFGREI